MGPTSTSEWTEMKCASTPPKKRQNVPAGATKPDPDSISKPGGFGLFTWLAASHHHRRHLSGTKNERLHSFFLLLIAISLLVPGKTSKQVVG